MDRLIPPDASIGQLLAQAQAAIAEFLADPAVFPTTRHQIELAHAEAVARQDATSCFAYRIVVFQIVAFDQTDDSRLLRFDAAMGRVAQALLDRGPLAVASRPAVAG